MTLRHASLAIPLLHHIYSILFAGELGGRGERRWLVVGGDGRAAGRRGDAGRVDPGHFGGRNRAVRMNPKICQSDAILERSVGPWRCSMRASAFRIAPLPSGMRVVCVRGRLFPTYPPPIVVSVQVQKSKTPLYRRTRRRHLERCQSWSPTHVSTLSSLHRHPESFRPVTSSPPLFL